MKRILTLWTLGVLGFAVILSSGAAWARPRSSAVYGSVFSTQIGESAVFLAMQYSSPPPWRVFENILTGDSRTWFGDRYVDESLSDVTLVEGTHSSGTWSARGYYYYISAWDDQQHTGWVIFRFRNGSFDCVVYHNFPRTCRRPLGY